MKNIAVIGCGYWGKNLVRNFYNLGSLRIICDTDRRKKKEHKNAYPEVDFSFSPDEVYRDIHVKAVVISTPAETHFLLAKKALLEGKDVFVEKPLAMKLREAEELVSLARQKRSVLMVDHLLQYHPAIETLKQMVEKGSLGAIQYVYSNRLSIGIFRKEENILWSFAPHDISVILSLVRKMPYKVDAFGEAYLQKNVYDTTLTTLVFRHNLKAHIFVNWLHPFKEQKLVVIGTKNMAVFDDQSNEKLVLYPHRVEWKNGMPVASKAPHKVVPINAEEPLKRACEHFIECIKTRKRPLTDGKEALKVMRVLHKAQIALEKKK